MSRAIPRRSRAASASSAASSAVTSVGWGTRVRVVRSKVAPAGSMCSTTPLARIGTERFASWALVTMLAGSITVTDPRPITRSTS